MISFLPLGGGNEIGASCFYLNVDGTGIVLDSGTNAQMRGIESLPRFDLIKDLPVDAALITHAHQDHIESLPYLVQRHPYLRLVTTPQTRAIAELTLHNAVGILQEELKDEIDLRPYSHEEIDLLIQSIEWRSYAERFEVRGYHQSGRAPVTASFHDAGHILGSAGILLEHEGHTVFYSGDINLHRQSLLPGAKLPDAPVDVLILESTHGSTAESDLPDHSAEYSRLATKANYILGTGGSILIPVFALGKLQEILVGLWRLMEKGRLAKHEIYTGGIGVKISGIYDKNRFVVPYNDPELLLGEIPQQDLYSIGRIEELFRRPSIVLAASGMVIEGTMSFTLAQRWLNQSSSAIFTVGYMDPETPGYRIAVSSKGDLLQLTDASEPQNVRCDIDRFRISSHSSRSGLLSIVQQLRPKTVILVHGEPASIDWMGHAILQRFPGTRVHAAEIGKTIMLFP